MMRRIRWWALFLGATYALSKVFEASRALTQSGSETAGVALLFWAVLLFLGFLILGYDAYQKAKTQGTLVRRVWLYEWFDAWRASRAKPQETPR